MFYLAPRDESGYLGEDRPVLCYVYFIYLDGPTGS